MPTIEKVETGIYRRGNSYLVPVYAGRDPITGKERRKWATARTLDEARRLRRQMQQEVEKSGHVPAQRMTLAEFLREKFIPEHVERKRIKTQRGYKDIIEDHLLPGLGAVRLDRLTREHLAVYFREKRKAGLSEQTLLHHFRLIHKALNCAVEWGYVGRNVADQLPPPRPKKYQATRLTAEQAERLLAYLADTRPEQERREKPDEPKPHPLGPLVAVALGTGCRKSELLGLTWDSVDFARGALYIRKSLEDRTPDGPVLGLPKRERGKRIPMADFVRRALLDRMLAVSQGRDFYAQDYRDFGLVFCKDNGTPIDPTWVNHELTRALRAINREATERAKEQGREPTPEELMPHIRFHDLRHTCAALLIKQGVHPKVVQEILGHSSIQVTMDIYGDLLPGVDEGATRKLDELFPSPREALG
ncbi:MAG: tyrosine-type recombinase/integrase [Bacillota bacterium]